MSGSSDSSKPSPPYYAVIFTSERTSRDDGYRATAQQMLELAAGQNGFLGVESVREEGGLGITVSYWASLDAIQEWKAVAEHQIAQQLGRERWYQHYQVRICRVEREYEFEKSSD